MTAHSAAINLIWRNTSIRPPQVLVLYRKRERARRGHEHGMFSRFRYNDLKSASRKRAVIERRLSPHLREPRFWIVSGLATAPSETLDPLHIEPSRIPSGFRVANRSSTQRLERIQLFP
jgi:hypothetical protein